MIGKALTICTYGFETIRVQVEADILPGNIGLQIVGLGDNALKESRERIRSAITHCGFHFPVKQIIVNLAPNERPKEGALSELAICTAILIADGQLPQSFFTDKILLGSLSLDGSLQKPGGILTGIISAQGQKGISGIIIPDSMKTDCLLPTDKKVFRIHDLSDLNELVKGNIYSSPPGKPQVPLEFPEINMNSIIGLEGAKKGLAYSAIGKHHTLMIGEPGAGKTMLARAMKGILPKMTEKEILETSQIYSSARLLKEGLILSRPFRAPHHSSSEAAIVGGGSKPMPGEISLSHNGVLFLDELMEFNTKVLQSLREPLEDRKITVSRAKGFITFPAGFQLVGATNPCRCGYLFSNRQECTCPLKITENLFRKILGPFMDRISVEIEVRNKRKDNWIRSNEEDSSFWKSKVEEASRRMYSRNLNISNSDLSESQVLKMYNRTEFQKLIMYCLGKVPLSNRGYLNTLRLGLSIMDFNESDRMKTEYIEEAFGFRVLFHLRQTYLKQCA